MNEEKRDYRNNEGSGENCLEDSCHSIHLFLHKVGVKDVSSIEENSHASLEGHI
jgi:hypothetical protein